MEKTNTETVEIKTQSSLMKKTKVQLIDIILRKDNVEKELRDVIKTHNKEIESLRHTNNKYKTSIEELNKTIEDKDKSFNTLFEDYKSICDDCADLDTSLYDTKIKYRFFKVICFLLVIIITIIGVLIS